MTNGWIWWASAELIDISGCSRQMVADGGRRLNLDTSVVVLDGIIVGDGGSRLKLLTSVAFLDRMMAGDGGRRLKL